MSLAVSEGLASPSSSRSLSFSPWDLRNSSSPASKNGCALSSLESLKEAAETLNRSPDLPPFSGSRSAAPSLSRPFSFSFSCFLVLFSAKNLKRRARRSVSTGMTEPGGEQRRGRENKRRRCAPKNPKPLNEAVCPDLVGLLAGGSPTPFHIGAPLAPALPSESVGSSSFFGSGLLRLGLAS
ncbi:hypothetical protein EYF80_032455 [Liparis tanakae]|uniref:Uncharacterized protein n=1 Tax=Liparis tanakae TaxID=230148 RepID=A0A4Z2GVA7_9TELE|nr:hypothetical protein EYF80_032455 [Liparis tanakae]